MTILGHLATVWPKANLVHANMRVAIVGTGYAGLTTAASLAENGHAVICFDVDSDKIRNLQDGVMPFFETGLAATVTQLAAQGRLQFTSDASQTFCSAEVVLCAVGTPPLEDGSADLRAVQSIAQRFQELAPSSAVLVVKSTVPPGTCDSLGVERIAHVPEFLRQGTAVADARQPDRIVVGSANDEVRACMVRLFEPFVKRGVPIIYTDVRSAEVTKYAANAFLATKISFINEIANFCDVIGADVKAVVQAIGLDPRIGSAFLSPGVGYGGSCFPKDVQALIAKGSASGYSFRILPEVHAVNLKQRERYYKKLLDMCDGCVARKRVAIWGLAFKPGTDDIREAPSVYFIERLLRDGATVIAHDPLASRRISERFPTLTLVDSPLEALFQADVLVRLTDDPSFPPIPSTMAVVNGRL